MTWGNTQQQVKPTQEEKDKQTMDWVFGKTDTSSMSSVFCGVYGFPGIGKSGFCMDCRSPEEVKEGKKVVILDLDGGCFNTYLVYHNADPNILVKNPIVRNGKFVDYRATYDRIIDAVAMIENNSKEMNVKAIIIDGIDYFLKICEQLMRMDLKKEPTDAIMPMFWGLRNKYYNVLIEQLNHLNVDRYLITHKKNDGDRNDKGMLINSRWEPDWVNATTGKVEQLLDINSETKNINGDIVIDNYAIVKKFRDDVGELGKRYPISKIVQKKDGNTTVHWYGLRIFNNKLNITNK